MSLRNIVLPLIALLVWPSVMFAQERDEQRIAELKKKLETLVVASKEYQAQGKKEAAAEHMAAAEAVELQIKDIMAAHKERSRERYAQAGMSREQGITALKQGIVALRTIDRTEEAKHLANILEDYVRGKRANRERSRNPKTERQIAAETIEIMQLAYGWLAETGRKKAADQLEHVIDARRLILKGNREGEAGEVIRTMPSRGQQIELLMLAAKVMSEHDKGREKAELVRHLANTFRRPTDREKRNREANQAEQRERHETERRETVREHRRDAVERGQESPKRSEGQIKRLEDQIQELRGAIKELRKRIDR